MSTVSYVWQDCFTRDQRPDRVTNWSTGMCQPTSKIVRVGEQRAPLTIVAASAKEFLCAIDAITAQQVVHVNAKNQLMEQVANHLAHAKIKIHFFDPIVKAFVLARNFRALAQAHVDFIDLLFFADEWYADGLANFDQEFFVQYLAALRFDQFCDLGERAEIFYDRKRGHTGISTPPWYGQKRAFHSDVPALIKEFAQFALLCVSRRTGESLSPNLDSSFYRRIARSVLREGAPYVVDGNRRRFQLPVAFESMLGLAHHVLPAYVMESILRWLWRSYDCTECVDEHQFWIKRCIAFHKRLIEHCSEH